MTLNWNGLLAPRMAGMTASEIRELLKLIEQPDIISFAGGIPDPDLFPREGIAAAYERVLRGNSLAAAALQYSVSEGYLPLREWIGARTKVEPDEILITSGSQQGLDFIGKLLLAPGDAVAVTAPTYLGALQAFSPYQPRYLAVPMDEHGIRTDLLPDVLAQGPKFLYLVPDFQNPNGITMSLERRLEVLSLCRRHGVPVIEDGAYSELRYDGERLPSLLSLDDRADGGIVLHAGTFSKTIVPALRVGWVSGPKSIISRLVLMKQAADLHSSTINQMVIHTLAEGGFDAHVARLRPAYRERRDAMLSALGEHFPAEARWTRPEGGMFVWVELPDGLDGTALLERSIREARVAFVPGAAFFPDRSGKNTIRLSFSVNRPERIREGIRRLGALVSDADQIAA
ncbi:PLP-dependent aminotransferase family protein [Arenibaculum sp.]|uniref:aminotransferase-like domain-containing protein n=1 Tax=Arenibaculum sp. TaxID=2865862 RepID=UPI002E143858|nr:PLP-dependent aminotransferase family protein [Arenibaculum sp.]